MDILYKYLPLAKNADAIISFAKSIGLNESSIKKLIVEGECSFWSDPIINPQTGEHHVVFNSKLQVSMDDTHLVFKIDDKDPETFFQELTETEAKIKKAAGKSGEAYEIYRQNIKLKQALEMKEVENQCLTELKHLLQDENERQRVLIDKLTRENHK